MTDTFVNQCRSDHQAISVFRDDVLAYPAQENIYAASGCYLGTTSSGHAVIANSNTGFSQGGFQYRVFDKDGTPLSTPLEIQGTNNNYKTIVRSELNPQNGLTVAGTITLPADSLTISNVNTLQTELTTIKEDVILLQTNKANDIDVVHLTNNEAISGDKTFGDDVIVMGDLKFQNSSLQTVNVETEFGLKANDTDVVHLTGDETIAGVKTFNNDVSVIGDLSFQNSSLELVNVETELGLKANDTDVVHLTGNETIAGIKTFSGDVMFNVNATIGDNSGYSLTVNSSTQLKNNVVIGDSKTLDTLTVNSKSIFQGMPIFRDAFQENNLFTDKTIAQGLYLGTTSSGHGLLAVPNTGAANGFLFRNIDKDGITINTPLNINQNGTCSFSGNVNITGTLNQTGDTIFGTTESNQISVNSFTWLKNDVRFGNDELTDTFVNQCRSDFQARTVFRDALNAYANQEDIYATQGLYLGALSNGRAILGSPNNGTENGFQFSNFSKDGLILNTPFYITQQGVCVTNGKLQVSADEFKVVDGVSVSIPANSLSISNVNTLQTELDAKAVDIEVVHLSGDETIAGVKTFNNDVTIIGDLSFQNSSLQTVNVETEFGLKANDTDVVHLTGDETIAGIKTYSGKAIFNGDVDIGDTGLEVLTIKANSSNLGLTLMSNEVDTITGAGSFASSGIYLGRQAGNIGTFVSGSAGGTGGFQFQNKNSDGTTLNNALTISRNGNITASGDLYTQSKLISNLIENVGTNNLVIKNNGGVVKFTNAADASNIEISANGTTTFLKRLYAKDVGSMQEKMTAANIDANEIIVDYAATSVIIIPSPSSGTGVFTTNIINMNSGAAINTSCIITLLINTATNKKYCNAITVGGTSISLLFSGGGAAIDISTSTFVQQSIAIIYTSDGDTPSYAISSVNPYLA